MKNKLNEKIIFNIVGKILKWFFIFEAAENLRNFRA